MFRANKVIQLYKRDQTRCSLPHYLIIQVIKLITEVSLVLDSAYICTFTNIEKIRFKVISTSSLHKLFIKAVQFFENLETIQMRNDFKHSSGNRARGKTFQYFRVD